MSNLHKRFPMYSAVLHFYPSSYRKEFGEQILQTTADMLDEATDKSERLKTWAAISLNTPGDIARQQVISIGERVNTNKRMIVSLLWVAVCIGAIALYPELRKVGTAWTSNAGFLRLIYLSLFILAFIVVTPIMAVLTWFGRPKSLYGKLARL